MRDQIYEFLKKFNVFTRRYFYPLCSEADCYKYLDSADLRNLPVAYRASREVLALPYFGDLQLNDAVKIAELIRWSLHNA